MGYILDTDILIYLLSGNKKIEKILNTINDEKFDISIISRFEVLIGEKEEKMDINELEEYLDCFNNIDLGKRITKEAVILNKHNKKKLKFKDLLIAATAKVIGKTLITSDKDFKSMDGVKVRLINL